MAATTTERKYALTRIKAGDYLLPSNDAQTIWRIMRYEDGPSHGLDWPKDREFWGIWKWLHHDSTIVDTEDWDSWAMRDSSHDTRQDAIEAALRGRL